MTWVRLDDSFAQHPKVLDAGPLAAWLHVAALCYCSRHGTDGFIPKSVLFSLAKVSKPSAVAAKLVAAKLWTVCEGGGYQIHDYLEWQPPAEEVKRRRKENNDRIKRWRNGRPVTPPVTPSVTRYTNVTNAVGNTVGNAVGNAFVTPPPSSSSSSSTFREDPPNPLAGDGSGLVTEHGLSQHLREVFAEAVRAETGDVVSPAPGATRGFTGLASLFRARNSTGTIAEATTWLQLSVRGFLRAERRSDGREPSDVLRWLNAGSPASPPPINGRTAVARPSPAQRIFNPKDHQ